MTVVAFPFRNQTPVGGWQPDELQQLIALFAAHSERGNAMFWDVGMTESGEPQFYLLGPAPDFECLLCCSRIDALYVLEDGLGSVVAQDRSLSRMRDGAVRAVLGRRRAAMMARLVVLLATFRVTIEQKLEPILAEGSEWFVRFAPQFAALA